MINLRSGPASLPTHYLVVSLHRHIPMRPSTRHKCRSVIIVGPVWRRHPRTFDIFNSRPLGGSGKICRGCFCSIGQWSTLIPSSKSIHGHAIPVPFRALALCESVPEKSLSPSIPSFRLTSSSPSLVASSTKAPVSIAITITITITSSHPPPVAVAHGSPSSLARDSLVRPTPRA